MTEHTDTLFVEPTIEFVFPIVTTDDHGINHKGDIRHSIGCSFVEGIGHRRLGVTGMFGRSDDESVAGQGFHKLNRLRVDAAIAV